MFSGVLATLPCSINKDMKVDVRNTMAKKYGDDVLETISGYQLYIFKECSTVKQTPVLEICLKILNTN